MKNKYLIIFLFILSFCNLSAANEFKFVTSEIKILDEGNLIEAINGKAISENNEIEIQAEKFEYNKNLKILKVDHDNNLILIRGAVPGHKGSLLKIFDCLSISYSMAFFTNLKEFIFLISALTPNSFSPNCLIEIFASHRKFPSSILQSETFAYIKMLLSFFR